MIYGPYSTFSCLQFVMQGLATLKSLSLMPKARPKLETYYDERMWDGSYDSVCLIQVHSSVCGMESLLRMVRPLKCNKTVTWQFGSFEFSSELRMCHPIINNHRLSVCTLPRLGFLSEIAAVILLCSNR